MGAARFVGGVLLAVLLAASAAVTRAAGQPPVLPAGGGEPPAAAQPALPPGKAPPLNQNVIDESIGRAVQFLRESQKPTGIWGDGNGKDVGPGGGWAVAYTALAGLALIESGVSPADRAVTQAAYVVRLGAPQLIDTYEISLAILFLDRLKDSKRDDRLIRMLAARLIAAQTVNGGWHYKTEKLGEDDADKLLAALRKITPAPQLQSVSFRERPSVMGLCVKTSDDLVVRAAGKGALDADGAEKVRLAVMKQLPANLKRAAVLKDTAALEEAAQGKVADDNSNTHFAVIGLWAARRHDVPTERTFTLLARRFRTSHASGGGWAYNYAKGGAGSTPAMTCVGLLGLAIGNALAVDPGAPRVDRDPAIIKSLTMLSTKVGAPTGETRNRPTPKDVGGLYYLWALERIAVLYDLRTLDDKDWYQWGAEILIGHQLPDGGWKDAMAHGDHPVVDTALAILFLKRANLTPDLSKRLILDTSVLTTRVGDTPPKKDPAPPPPPKKESGIDLSGLFAGPTQTEPAPKEQAPAPKTSTPTTAPAPAVADTPPSKKDEDSSPWMLIAGVVGALILAGAGIAFVVLRKKPEEKPKKGKKGKKGAAKAAKKAKPRDDDDDEDEE